MSLKGKLLLVFHIFLLISLNITRAQVAVLHGFVREKGSMESLPGAHVFLQDRSQGTTANNFGYYSLMLAPGTHEVVVSFTGYLSQRLTIHIENDTLVHFLLEPVTLAEVVVEADRLDISDHDPNRTLLSMQQIKQIPPFLGEYDIMKGLALTPGVNTGTDGQSGIFVRGGTVDQNLVLLDGATVYNNNHLFGMFSVFNPEAVQSVELIKGGFPARYGGRLSSVVNVNMKEGNREKIKSNFTLGPLSSQYTIDGPINRGKSSFMLSGRAAYLSLIGLPWYYYYRQPNTGIDTYFNYYLYDLNAKFNHSFSDSRKLFVSFYGGQDIFYQLSREGGMDIRNQFGWGNKTGSVRYIDLLSPRWFSETMFTLNTYDFKTIFHQTDLNDSLALRQGLELGSGVFDINFRQRFEFTASPRHRLSAGYELIRHQLTPDYYRLENIMQQDAFPRSRMTRYRFYSTSAYVEDYYQLSFLTLRSGLRFAAWWLDDKQYFSLEPRINLEVPLTRNSALTAAYTQMKQPLHLLSRPGQGVPVDAWVPITENVPPQQAHQYSLGFNRRWNLFTLDVGAYYKTMSDVIDYQTGMDFLANLNQPWENLIETGGIGRAYGAEFMVEKTRGRFNGWLAYTLAWNQRKFNNINQGQWYNARYDRRHDLNLVGAWKINDNWKVSATFVYHTGIPVTLPTAMIHDIHGDFVAIYTERNNFRMPHYHRLDLAFQREYISRRGRRASLSFGAFNVYANANPLYMGLNRTGLYTGGPSFFDREYIGFETRYRSGTLFGLIPFFSYTVYFDGRGSRRLPAKAPENPN